MEISINELRIGNYLLIDDLPCSIEYGIGRATFGENLIDGVPIERFKPIPLTEEWLLKFGFEVRDDNPKQKPHYEGDVLFNMCGMEFTNSVNGLTAHQRGFYCYELNDGNTILFYVHQLQNLYFALTNQELTINTNK